MEFKFRKYGALRSAYLVYANGYRLHGHVTKTCLGWAVWSFNRLRSVHKTRREAATALAGWQ